MSSFFYLSGGSTRPGFLGGSNPLYKSVRKYGFKNPNKIDYQELNLNQLQLYLDTGRISQPEDRALTIRDLKDSGIFKGLNKPVKILGNVSVDPYGLHDSLFILTL